MAATLERLAATANLRTNPFVNVERLREMRMRKLPDEPEARMKLEFQFALELLRAGETLEGVHAFERLWAKVQTVPGLPGTAFGAEVQGMLALAHLRLGEQENCVALHGADSCLVPIQGDGIHRQQRGSRAAIAIYRDILRERPNEYMSRWLLNVACMTVNEYPSALPAELLIPPQAFRSDHDVKRFYNVATPLGLDVVGLAGGAILEDFDGDAHLDLMVSSWGLRDPLRCFRNQGDGSFRERTEAAGLTGLVSGLNIIHADPDNDGDADVFVLRGAWLGEDGLHPNSLLRNRGDGSFDDVTEESGLLSFHPTQAGAWGDYDNDGWLDLFIANESAASEAAHPCQLYHNRGDGSFEEVAARAGVAAVGFFKSAVWGDYDNDGRIDLYAAAISMERPGNLLFHNDGPDASGQWRFSERGAQAGVREPQHAFPSWFFDFDNDGWQDIFVSGYRASAAQVAAEYLGVRHNAELPRLYRNNRDGTFREVSREMKIDKVLFTMGCNFGDLDNDGWLDFYAGTGNPDFRSIVPNRMFRNAGGKVFQDVTTSGGFGHLQKGHGVAFGDLDNDGDQDVYCKIGGAYVADAFRSALFLNPGHGNRWITLKLTGVKSNRAAIGARIRAGVDTPAGPRDIHVTAGSGSSFGGSSLRQEIGLGNATRLRELEIRWPAGGKPQRFEDVAMDQMVEVREGSSELIPLRLGRVNLRAGHGG